ncbi:MAG TPA: alpha/beta hydrolase [Gordonia polyisoprenivorans]|nr:alpha/beta hydrolase [Gordonia polyisoprenivorans]
MVDPELRTIPAGLVDVTVGVSDPEVTSADALSHFAPDEPAMPMYQVIANNRAPVALRDLMIAPVRSGYVGDGHQPDPTLVPPSGAQAVPDVDVSEIYVPVDGGVARCQLYRPTGTDPEELLQVLVYFHGGGFTVGSSDDCDFLTRKLAATNRALVVSANYRLAPEFPFPVPLDDAYGVYRWVTGNASRIGGDTRFLGVAGDSSGSNFAAAIPLRCADDGVRTPDAVVLLGAMVDFRFERWASFREQAPRGIVYDTAFTGFIRGAYLPTTPWDHPYASPIEGDLHAFPATVIATGTHDPIIDSARAFADRLGEAGTSVTTYFPAGMPHGFYFFPGVHPEEDVAYRIVADALAPLISMATAG